MTKKNGAGSLAHEWFHGLDNYFARSRGDKLMFLTDRPFEVINKSIRPEVIRAFKGIVQSINESGLPKRSQKRDSTRSKAYYSTIIEMGARSFESYVIDKMNEKQVSNDYLANIMNEEAWQVGEELGMEGMDEYPYPLQKEAKIINKAFDDLFNVIDTKKTDFGTALFSKGETSNQTKQKLRSEIGTTNNNVKIVQSTTDLPFDVAKDVAGAYNPSNNTIYMVADNIPVGHGKNVLLHELAHQALQQSPLYHEFYNALDKLKNSKIYKEAKQRAVQAGTKSENMNEEIMTYVIENYPQHSFVKRMMLKVRNWMRKTFGLTEFNMDDAYEMLNNMSKGKESYIQDQVKAIQNNLEQLNNFKKCLG